MWQREYSDELLWSYQHVISRGGNSRENVGKKKINVKTQTHKAQSFREQTLITYRGTRDQIANICCITEKARESQKNIYFCFDFAKAFDCGSQAAMENSSKDGNTRPP